MLVIPLFAGAIGGNSPLLLVYRIITRRVTTQWGKRLAPAAQQALHPVHNWPASS